MTSKVTNKVNWSAIKNLMLVSVISTLLAASSAAMASGSTDQKASSTEKSCSSTRLGNSIAAVMTILDDVKNHYDQTGGEITAIKSTATNTYTVSISQEERIDQLTYKIAVANNCSIKVLSREISAISPWQQ